MKNLKKLAEKYNISEIEERVRRLEKLEELNAKRIAHLFKLAKGKEIKIYA